MTYRKCLATDRTMTITLRTLATVGLAIAGLAGCSTPASQSSPESVRDPLGIDRAVNDYYFPNGAPAADIDSIEATSDRGAPPSLSEMDDQP